MAPSTVGRTDLLVDLDLRRIDVSARLDPKRRAKLGQFFTPAVTARLMASMFAAETSTIRLLDAGAGIGLLTAAFVDELCHRESRPELLSVIAFELDAGLIPQLDKTLSVCREACENAGIRFEAEIRHEDFIAAATASLGGNLFSAPIPLFDCAVLNPPYKKINSNSGERRLLRSLGIETSNLYAGFLALVAELLKPGGSSSPLPRAASAMDRISARSVRRSSRQWPCNICMSSTHETTHSVMTPYCRKR